MKRARSELLFEAATRLFPGGVNSPVRAFKAVGGTPPFLVRAGGSHVYDADGYGYIDYVASWGPLILGHANPAVVAAITRTAAAGTSFGAPHPLEVELAELIQRAMPSVEMLRFVNSGTEACMSALRLARAHTGREMIVKCDGCYHGHADALLVSAGSGALTFGVPSSAGINKDLAAKTLVVPYNDIDALERAFKQHGSHIACIIIEPIAANMGLVLPERGYLGAVASLARRHGALLVFDEVITGFRVSLGGAQALYGLAPDLTCLGKIVGGGLPVGAFGGRAEVMRRLSPLGDVYQAGTLSGNPIAMAAGAAQLRELSRTGVYERLESLAAALEAGLRQAIGDRASSVQLSRIGSMLGIFFNSGPVKDLSTAQRSDTAAYAAFFHAMLERGVYLPPSQFEVSFVSLAHSRADIDDTVVAAADALSAMHEKLRR